MKMKTHADLMESTEPNQSERCDIRIGILVWALSAVLSWYLIVQALKLIAGFFAK